MKESNEDFVIAVDSSGVKVSNRGEWIRHKWKVRKGWIKVHIAVDVKTKEVVSIEITDESVGDGKMLSSLADGSYDKSIKKFACNKSHNNHSFH